MMGSRAVEPHGCRRETLRLARCTYSGNQCAFEGCTQPLITKSGGFVGRIAHIHAAADGGPRAVRTLTAEQRRDQENLMLLCATHAAEIDDVPGNFPVEVLRKMKQTHEGKFMDALKSLGRLVDVTAGETPVLPPHYFGRITSEEVQSDAEEFRALVDSVAKLPHITRQFYFQAICRADRSSSSYGSRLKVHRRTLLGCFKPLTDHDLRDHIQLLADVDLAWWEEEDDSCTGYVEFTAPGDGDLIGDLKELFAALTDDERAKAIEEFVHLVS